MKFDLIFMLIDIGDNINKPWYQAAAKLMIASARRAYAAHDMRIVQVTDEASEVADDIDIRFCPSPKLDPDELMQYRGYCIAEWALQSDRPMVFCDVDLLWNNDKILNCFLTYNEPYKLPHIILFKRDHMEIQPFNGGLILTQPHQTQFWEIYRAMMKHLPKDIRGWWGDQIGLAVMMGLPEPNQGNATKFGSRVCYLPVDIAAPSPKEKPTKLTETPAIHLKGAKRKPWLADYFNMLFADVAPVKESA